MARTRRANVHKVSETDSGLNKQVSINGVIYTHNQAYAKAKKGQVPGYHGVNNHGTKFIRSNPDRNKSNNLE